MKRTAALVALSLVLLAAIGVLLFSWSKFNETGMESRPLDRGLLEDQLREGGGRERVRPAEGSAPLAQVEDGAEDTLTRSRREVLVFETLVAGSREDRAIDGAEVVLVDRTGRSFAGTSGADGKLAFDEVADGAVRATAEKSGYVTTEIGNGEWRTVVLVMEPAVEVWGHVVDENGDPVVGAEVRVASGTPIDGGSAGLFHVSPLSADLGRVHATIRTDYRGRFTARGIPPGRPVAVSARKEGRGPAQVVTTSPIRGQAGPEVLVTITPAGSLTGQVTAPNGSLAVGALVCAIPRTELEGIALVAAGGLPRSGLGIDTARVARTDSSGRYRLEGLLLDTDWWVTAASDVMAPAVAEPALRVTAASPTAMHDFRLRTRGKLTVRIVGPDGRVVAGSWASVAGSAGWGASTVPGSAVHEFRNLVPDEVLLRVGALGHPPSSRTVTIAEGDTVEVDVRLVEGLDFAVRVVDAEGHAVAGAQVALTHDDGQGTTDSSASATSGEDGVALLRGLRPARHDVLITARTFARSTAEVDVPGSYSEDGTPVDVAVSRGGLIRVRIEGRAPSFGVVQAQGPVDEIVVLDEKTLRGEVRVPPGRYVLTLWNTDRDTIVDVEEGATVDAVIRDD